LANAQAPFANKC